MSKQKYIETPEKLWELFQSYKQEVKSKPVKKMVFVGKDGAKEYEERERPLTLDGFENYVADQDVISDLDDYFENKDDRYNDYVTICARIKRVIRQDQIEGGMTNIYNASITQRLNGLKEQSENINHNVEQPLFPDVK